MKTARAMVTAAVVLTAAVPGARALPPLSHNEHIVTALTAAAIGDRIRRECPSISPRLLKLWREARALKAYARAQGYSEAQIEAFIDDDAEKDRFEDRAARYLAARGAVAGRDETYCAIGRREIARGSLAGSLLRAH